MVLLRFRLAALAALVAALALPVSSRAFGFGSGDRAGGRLVAPGLTAPRAISDEAGGVIVAARDAHTGAAIVNRYSSSGAALWHQGIGFPDAAGVQIQPDGAGGVVVGVQNAGSGDLLVSRIVSSGSTIWQATFPAGVLASDGAGGAWVISQSGELFADGIAPDGAPRARIQLTDSPDGESLPVTLPDGSGGTFLAWRAAKPGGQFVLVLQHLDLEGSAWGQATEVAGSSDPSITPALAPDGRGGVLISWNAAGAHWIHDYSAEGRPVWNRVLTLPSSGARLSGVSAGANGTFVAWTLRTRGEPLPVDLLRVSFVGPDGSLLWNRDLGAVQGGILDVTVAGQRDAVVVGWQWAPLPIAGQVVDADLSIARVDESGAVPYRQALASSLGPDAFGSVVDGGDGWALAVFSQSPCLRTDVSGVVLQRISGGGAQAFGADGACP